MRYRFGLVVMFLVAYGCGGGGGSGAGNGTPSPPPVNVAPTADAGGDISQSITPDPVALDGSGSSDFEGGALSYSWSVLSQPAAQSISLTSPNSVSPTFVSMVPGDYEFELTVTDSGAKTATDNVSVTLTNDAPEPTIANVAASPLVGSQITLDGTPSTDPNSHALSFEWRVIEFPSDSGVPTALSGPTHDLEIDTHGVYVFELTVSDGYAEVTEIVVVEATVYTVDVLTTQFQDAEYNEISQYIVTVADASLTVIDPNGDERSVALPAAATAVSISPDGLTAAVAHDGQVSHVDVDRAEILATYSVPMNIGDIILDGNAFAHGFSAETTQFQNILSIDLSTGAISNSAGLVYEGTRAKLHPDGDRIYGAQNGISPGDLGRYLIGATGAEVDYDSPYHGEHAFCGDIWLSPVGDIALTRCRTVVRTTNDPESDLNYAFQFDGPYYDIRHASVNGFDEEWLVAHEGGPNSGEFIRTYGMETGSPVRDFILPHVDDNAGRWTAMYVFGSSSSDAHRVLAVDDPDNPTQFAILTKQMFGATNYNLPPRAEPPRYRAARISDNVILDASDSYDPEGQTLSFNWVVAERPVGSSAVIQGSSTNMLQFIPDVAGVYEFELTVSDGERTSQVARSSVQVAAESDNLVLRLEGYVIDSEYSEALDVLAYVTYPDRTLRLLNLADLTTQEVPLTRNGFDVGISPDGLHAAISHAGMASLVDLQTGTVIDTQIFDADWGDIVLDHSLRAHLIPNRRQWVELYTLDFAADQWDSLDFIVWRDGRIRMHPTEDWLYVANRGLVPDRVLKYDVSTMPASYVGRSDTPGFTDVAGDAWISEDGDNLLAASGNRFHTVADPTLDMTMSDSFADNTVALSADHSTESDEWVVVTRPGTTSDPNLDYKMLIFSDVNMERLDLRDLEPILHDGESTPTIGQYVSFSDDGSRIIVLLSGDELYNPFAVQISDR